MNGYGREYGVSYRTLQRIFETLEMKRAKAEATAARIDKVIHSKLASNLSRSASMKSVIHNSVSSDRMDKLCDGLGGSNDSDSMFRDKDSEEGDHPVYSYSVHVSMMEIYNEQVYDLLAPSVTSGPSSFSTSAGTAAQSAGNLLLFVFYRC